jgi:anti-sigma B factor antagonist
VSPETTGSHDWDSAGQVRCEPAWSGYRVVLLGEVDLNLAEEWDRVLAILADAEPSDVTVDLSATTFIDSSALGSLVRLNRAVSARGGAVVLAGADGSIARTIRLAGLDAVIPMLTPQESSRRN